MVDDVNSRLYNTLENCFWKVSHKLIIDMHKIILVDRIHSKLQFLIHPCYVFKFGMGIGI
jgi:hypothetical protein